MHVHIYRLILIAEKDKVYDKFPIPLINRLEKHIVTTSTILSQKEKTLLEEFNSWIESFTTVYLGFVALTLLSVAVALLVIIITIKYIYIYVYV